MRISFADVVRGGHPADEVEKKEIVTSDQPDTVTDTGDSASFEEVVHKRKYRKRQQRSKKKATDLPSVLNERLSKNADRITKEMDVSPGPGVSDRRRMAMLYINEVENGPSSITLLEKAKKDVALSDFGITKINTRCENGRVSVAVFGPDCVTKVD
ncbi:PREDICTED: uncharacterized protein LOC105556852 [Vollenhovia emeryi]|uniref:uncharacterized protein LOC105556852 n=1 Tax=Vollenhovia emeryi TaxID=411798 RepID=UPI0005F3B462|nr:PREDICTED: uncharacterized protein LOC105556852 [Vollenhovia emeryi]